MKKALFILSVVLLIDLATARIAFASQYGNPYGNDSNSPHVTDSEGNYKGNLNDNQYDPNSVSNPYGQYGSKYSSDSINNPYRNW